MFYAPYTRRVHEDGGSQLQANTHALFPQNIGSASARSDLGVGVVRCPHIIHSAFRLRYQESSPRFEVKAAEGGNTEGLVALRTLFSA